MKTFFKFLGKNKLYTAINLFGLAVSLMFVILIADYGNSMLGIDRFHTNKDRIYLIGNESGYSSNHSVSMQLQGQFPEIEKMCGIVNYHVIGYAL
ncbi:MAG: ABC transporter permease, partial [Bacteroidales bacterium]|nr:ABC transporter permease [Bacteroidales bacterium]